MESVVDTVSRDWIETTTPSILNTPRARETLPSARKMLYAYQLLVTFEPAEGLDSLVDKQVYLLCLEICKLALNLKSDRAVSPKLTIH